jgi:AraC family transcriptional regulator of adaptative response / DNA-3-methyladenine glycosylase II
MSMSRNQMLDGMYRRDEALNGRYIVGVTSTRIYCLPDCPARKPKAENVVFFLRERDAHNAGFRACKRCRPDNYYRGIDQDHGTLTDLIDQVRNNIAAFPNVRSLVRASGFGSTKLANLCIDHFHQTPAGLLRSLRIQRAAELLTTHRLSPMECCFAAGFGSLATFYQQFPKATGMTPAAYGALPGKSSFTITLPRGYSSQGIKALLARDPDSSNQGFTGTEGFKAVSLAGLPARLELELRHSSAQVRINSPATLPPEVSTEAHSIALRLLGLHQHRPSAAALKREPWAALVNPAPALRPALYATPFEALLWAIIGQQINIRFAATLIRRINELVAARLNTALVLPATALALAELDAADLTKLQCSGAKSNTISQVARAIANDELPLDRLATAGAEAARQCLLAHKGVGPWTSEYVLMRGIGFADCLPLGDSGLRNGAERFFNLPGRPDSGDVASHMAVFAPYRSLATHHIWMSHSG